MAARSVRGQLVEAILGKQQADIDAEVKRLHAQVTECSDKQRILQNEMNGVVREKFCRKHASTIKQLEKLKDLGVEISVAVDIRDHDGTSYSYKPDGILACRMNVSGLVAQDLNFQCDRRKLHRLHDKIKQLHETQMALGQQIRVLHDKRRALSPAVAYQSVLDRLTPEAREHLNAVVACVKEVTANDQPNPNYY